jgi:aminoglycoside phosphotransferase (APT) family kinase protein
MSFPHPYYRGIEVILMDRLTGASLDHAWERLSDEKKDFIAEQLERYISQLRALPPPSGLRSICSVTGGPIRCYRLHVDATTGPFRDEEHMNLQLRHLQPLDDPRFPEILRKVHPIQHPLVFTHNDFFPRNIMIDEESAKVVAVLDWESAGWFPSHWEYCKCHNWGAWRMDEEEWRTKYLPRIVPVYEEEAEADRALMYDCDFNMYPGVHA